MADNRLRIIIDANASQAQGELGTLAKDLRGVGSAATEASDKQVAGNQRAGLSLTDLASGLSLAKQGFQAVEGAVKSVIDPFVSYANEVEDLGRNSGLTAEQSSKLIQVSDDLRINFDTLKMAAKEMNKDGIQPSFETLRDLARQYQAIPDPVGRAQFAQQHFGRSAQEMTKFLETNIEALDQMSEAVNRSGLVLDEEGVAKAKAYQEAMDDAGDAIDAVKMALAQDLIPALTAALKAESDVIDVQHRYDAALKAGALTAKDLAEIRQADLIGNRAWGLAVLEAAEAEYKAASAISAHEEALNEDVPIVLTATSAYSGMIGVAIESEGALLKAAAASGEAAAKADWLASRVSAAADAHDAMLKVHRTWLDGVAGDVVNALHEAGVEGNLYLAALHGIDATYGTDLAAQAAYEEKLAAITAEFAKTGDVVAFDQALQRLADGGASEAAAKLEAADAEAIALKASLDAIPREVRVNVLTLYSASGTPGYTGAGGGGGGGGGNDATGGGGGGGGGEWVPPDVTLPGAAGGIDFIVPPGFNRDSFLQPVQSGEHVRVTPAGQSEPTRGGDTYHVHINDKLSAALWMERTRQHVRAGADALMG